MKKSYLFVLLLFITQFLLGQNEPPQIPIVTPSQPEVAELGRYGEIPVGKFSGIPSVGIPLYTINSGDISIPISLSYYAGGIRVNQEATWVGLGWSLLGANNVITRTIKGKQDEGGSYFLLINRMFDVYANGDFLPGFHGIYDTENGVPVNSSSYNFDDVKDDMFVDGELVPSFSLSRLIKGRVDTDTGDLIDWEPDLYTFNFLGYSGSFVIDQSRNIHIISKDSKLIFTKLSVGGWEVKTPDGLTLLFNMIVSSTNNNKTDWFLSEITSPTGKNVLFNYSESGGFSPLTYFEKFETKYTIGEGFIDGGGYKHEIPMPDPSPLVYLDTITFQDGYVLFEKSDREDFIGKKLERMSIFSKADIKIKEIQFNTSYFESVGGEGFVESPGNHLTKRLKLNSIDEIGSSGTVKTHGFEYNLTPLPAKSSFSTDFWGYYNGKSNNSFIPDYTGLIASELYLNGATMYSKDFIRHLDLNFGDKKSANREPELNSTQASVLNKIIYPTKGSSSFEYELNDYSNTEQEFMGEEKKVFFQNVNSGSSDPNVESITFTVPPSVAQKASIEIIAFDGTSSTADFNGEYISITGTPSIYLNQYADPFPNTVSGGMIDINIQPNSVITLAIHKSNDFVGAIDAKLYYYDAKTPLKKEAGGLRIKKITNDDATGSVEVTNYRYNSDDGSSYGIIKTPNRFQDISNYIYLHLIDGGPGTVFYEYDIYSSLYTRFYGSSNTSLSYNQNNAIGYTKVIETKGINSELGYTEFNYYNRPNIFVGGFLDRPITLPTYSRRFDGKLQSENYYSSSNKILKSINYEYKVSNKSTLKAFYRGFRYPDHGRPSNVEYEFSSNLHYYSIFTRREALVKKTDSIFDTNGNNPITTTSNYFYDNDAHLQLTRSETTDSKGNLIKIKTEYPHDKLNLANLSPEASTAIDSLIIQQRTKVKNKPFLH